MDISPQDWDRARRMAWWHNARFGMFVHWGLYAQLGRHEWVLHLERMPWDDYDPLADTWQPRPGAAREWAALAKRAGMNYMVMTTKHHEGFCLWDTRQTDFNAVRRGPKRDLVADYVQACREAGLRVGFYYSLMDWHHPDGFECSRDEEARRRFVDFTHGCVRELMTNYGTIDVLWYDVPAPLATPELWESQRLNAMVRELQPDIVINDRSRLPEDFGTPEEHIEAADEGRGWEACMTFNGSWGWAPTPPDDWHSPRRVVQMLRECVAGGGNLLLNVGPLPDGSLPAEAVDRLETVGRWLSTHGEAVYGPHERCTGFSRMWNWLGHWTRVDETTYHFWCRHWPGRRLVLGGIQTPLRTVMLLDTGARVAFNQEADRVILTGLPCECPDPEAGVAVFRLTFAAPLELWRGFGNRFEPAPGAESPLAASGGPRMQILQWHISRLYEAADLMETSCVSRDDPDAVWRPVAAASNGFVAVRPQFDGWGGLVYFISCLHFPVAGQWTLRLGHDGGVKLFVEGQPLALETECRTPARPGRTCVTLDLDAGDHEVVVALDLADGRSRGIFFSIEAANDTLGADALPTVVEFD